MWKRYPLTPTPHYLTQSSNHVFFLAGRWSTSGWGGNAHFLPPHKNTIEGNRRKQNRRTNTNKAWGYQEQRKVCNTTCMCIPDSRYGLTLAWVTSENSTGIRHLETLLHWTLSCLLASLLGVWCWLPLRGSTPTASAPVQLPTASAPVQLPTLLSSGSRRQLSFASPYYFRVQRDFMSKNPLSGFAPKQTIESSALAAYPHSATQSVPFCTLQKLHALES